MKYLIGLVFLSQALAQPSPTGLPAPAVPTEAPAVDPPATLKADWLALLASGCDLAKRHVLTTIEASALRNTPYALKGYAFKSPELVQLYQADGGWYAPDPAVKEPTFTAEEQACIKKLKDHEAALDARLEIPKAFKARFLADHRNVLDLRANTGQIGERAMKFSRVGDTFVLECPDCSTMHELQLHCEPDACHLLVPGL